MSVTVNEVEEKALEVLLESLGKTDTVGVAETALSVWQTIQVNKG